MHFTDVIKSETVLGLEEGFAYNTSKSESSKMDYCTGCGQKTYHDKNYDFLKTVL